MSMHDRDDEEEERRRQAEERSRLSAIGRFYSNPPRKTASGDDDLRSNRRTGRVVQISLRVQVGTRAILGAIIERDRPPSLVVLFEEMLDAYQKVHGAIDRSHLPSEDELINRLLEERDKRDGE
jgi:hypothetical protein